MKWFPHPVHAYMVFDKLHMLQMGIWSHHQAITTTCVGPDLGSQLKSCIPAGLQMTQELCSG